MAATLLEDAKLEQSAGQALETPLLSREQASKLKDTSYDQKDAEGTKKQECSRGWAGVSPEMEPIAVLAILVGGALAIVICPWALAACYGFCCACMLVP